MYAVSDSYKTAISANVRYGQAISGQITLNNGTQISVSNQNIVSGSLIYTAQIGDGFGVGGATAAQLEMGLITDIENPYSLEGARVTVTYGIATGAASTEDEWEWVPLGIFYVKDIERCSGYVRLTALDSFVQMDVDIGDAITSGTLDMIIRSLCSKAGISSNLGNYYEFPNCETEFSLPADSEVETLRDCLMWACQLLGCFGRINREGIFELVHLHSDSVRTILPGERSGTTTVNDTFSKTTKVTMSIDNTDYAAGTSGQTLELDENPFLKGVGTDAIQSVLDAILAEVKQAGFTPMSCTLFGDPALMPGDYITLTSTAALDGDPVSLITSMTWTFRGTQSIEAEGLYDASRRYSQSDKAVSAIKAAADAAKKLAKAANNSTQLLNQAMGGNILIRKETGERNEVLIMDSTDPEKAVKIWRWNMGGFGYSNNCTGADNPNREYEVAMTMDGAVSADFVKTGILQSQSGSTWIDMDNGNFNFGGMYYDNGTGQLTIGSPDSTLQTVYMGGKISFRSDGEEVAYISGASNRLYIRYAYITESLRIGSFAFVPRRSGNLSLIRVHEEAENTSNVVGEAVAGSAELDSGDRLTAARLNAIEESNASTDSKITAVKEAMK